jgi:two-component system, sensor histidine kinase and response regulator
VLEPAQTTDSIPVVASGVRILLVDDDPRVRRALAGGLTRAGFHVYTAEDAGPAIALAEQMTPDLVIVDLNMPTSGLEVVKALKAKYGSGIWIAVLSGGADKETRAECFDAGADDVIQKPAQLPELRRRMAAAARTQQAYVENRLAREQSDRLMTYGGEAAAMLAHDLNNGLAVALFNLSMLNEDAVLPPQNAEMLTASLNALRRMSGLVANFVDIARFEDSAVRLQASSCQVHELLRSVVEVHAAAPKQVKFEITCDESIAGTFDVALVERVLHNLVGNAVRYTKDGTIRIAAERIDDTLELRVTNNGPPVSEEVRTRLFVKYGKDTHGRRGFGLYFCRLVVEAHGGTIAHVPTPDGTTFRVRLP